MVPDVPEPTAPAEAGEPAHEGSQLGGQGVPTPLPEHGGETIDGVALTFYTCVGDSTGQYCGIMASGQTVHRGAAACGYFWEFGQRFRILADPHEGMVYTCLDRGAGPYLWVDVWFNDATEGRAWRNQLPVYVTVEMQ